MAGPNNGRMHRTRELLGILLLVCLPFPLRAADHTMVSSKTMYAMNVDLIDRYRQTHPNVRFRVSDAGTAKAIEGLTAGTIDVAAVTRPMRPNEEKEFQKRYRRGPISVPIALEGISVFLHPRNRVETMTIDQFARVMNGEIRNWKELGGADLPIHVYSFDQTTGRYWYVQEQILGKTQVAKDAQYMHSPEGAAPAAGLAAQQEQMLRFVSTDPSAIGYGDLKRVRIVKIARIVNGRDSYWPTPDAIQEGRYPLVRQLMFMLRDEPEGELNDFLQWCRKQSAVIREHDFVPMRSE